MALASDKPARLRRLRRLRWAWRVLEALVSRLPTAHLALFFLDGAFTTLSQRICRLRPVCVWGQLRRVTASFRRQKVSISPLRVVLPLQVPHANAELRSSSSAQNSVRLLAAMLGAQLALECVAL